MSLVGGVGLVALYALGVRAVSAAVEEDGSEGWAVAAVSLVVVGGAAFGLYVLLSA